MQVGFKLFRRFNAHEQDDILLRVASVPLFPANLQRVGADTTDFVPHPEVSNIRADVNCRAVVGLSLQNAAENVRYCG